MYRFPSPRVRTRAARFVPHFEALEERTLLSIALAPPINTNAGMQPLSVAVADFNHDGKLDVAVGTQAGTEGVSLLLGDGHGGFTPAPGSPLLAGTPIRSVVAGDFNGDGSPDLAVSYSNDRNVAVLLNNGSGAFALAPGSPHDTGAGTNPDSLAVGDFTNDGKLDLLVALRGSQEVGLFTGHGDGGLAASTLVGTNGNGPPVNCGVGDFDGDGNLDFAVTDAHTGKVQVFFGNGHGGFGSETDLPVGSGPVGLAVGDFNGDGKPDLAVTDAIANNVDVVLNTGGGHFAAPIPFAVPGEADAVAAADFNGDGKLDLAVTGDTGITVLQGDGHGGFATAPGSPFPGAGNFAVAAGDFNGDGAVDVAGLNFGANNVAVLRNRGGTRTTLTASANPAGLDQSVTFTATVTPTVPGNGTPGGTVTFLDGGIPLAVVPLDGAGQASFTTSGLATGSHAIGAAYAGDGTFVTSTPAEVLQVVNPVGDVTASVVVTPGPVHHSRQKVTLRNTGDTPLAGPFWLVLEGLKRHIKLQGHKGVVTGLTRVQPPPGTPFQEINLPALAPGQQVVVTLTFSSSRGRGIHYTAAVFAGTGPV
jgi:hypothetical protein